MLDFRYEALAACRAKHPGVTVWGRALNKDEPISPGDIIQFEKNVFKSGGSTRWMPHHTAIVGCVKGPNVVLLLHQNTGGSKNVKSALLDLGTKTDGEYVIYRPLPR